MDYLSSGFPEIDRSEDADFFFSCLETMNSMPFFQDYKEASFRLLKIKEGFSILDVGCGLGFDVISMGRMVGSSGRVVGLDFSKTVISEARSRSQGLGLPVEFVQGDAQNLEFQDGAFDCARVDRALQHISDPARALREMARVVKRGGTVMAFEPDWGTFAVSSADREVTRKVLNLFCDSFRSGWIGRQLPAHFHDCGLEEVSVEPRALMITDFKLADRIWDLSRNAGLAQSRGLISEVEANCWISELKDLDAKGSFFGCHFCFLVSGKKPLLHSKMV